MADTTLRALRLLTLLQSRPTWSGAELADRLGVTGRSVRRDIERLRELGYPVRAAPGVGGGYQLRPGQALPPLALDDEEAVAIALSLRTAAGGTVAGVEEAALRALTKLDQVLPSRLRARTAALQAATVTPGAGTAPVDADVLVTLARASREAERVELDYTDRDGAESHRRVEPYQLVATGRRWYLLAWDTDRDDWRTLRLDRISGARATGWRFRPREAPDPAAYVSRAVSVSAYRHEVVVRASAPASALADRVPPTAATLEPIDEDSCWVRTGTDSLEMAALHLMLLDCDVEVVAPPELREVLASAGARLTRAARGGVGGKGLDPGDGAS